MPKVRGYTSYRGRGPLWKLVVTVLLLAVILASFGVLLMKRSMVVDSSGVAQVQFPWQDDGVTVPAPQEQDEVQEPVELSEQEAEAEPSPVEPEPPAEPEPFHVYPVRAAPLSVSAYEEIAYLLKRDSTYNAVSVQLKDPEGWVYFDSPHIIYTEVITESKNIAPDTTQALQQLTASDAHTIARFTCFRDWRASNGNVRARLRNTSGRIFQDGNEDFWLDPSKEVTRAYLCDLAKDAAELGFDEIMLTDACYPTVGRLDRILYGDKPKGENLAVFFLEMKKALEPYNIRLSVEVPKEVLLTPDVPHDSGLSIDVFAPYVDCVYANVEPSEVEACTQALAGVLMFVPELSALPNPAPIRYVYA